MICKNPKIQDIARQLFAEGCLIIDSETSGGKSHQLIDLAIVEFPTGKVLFDSLVYTDGEMNYYAQQVHQIPQWKLKLAPKFHDLWFQIEPILKHRTVLAFNAAFDRRILESAIKSYNFSVPEINWLCLMNLYKEYKAENYFTNLAAACQELNVKSGNHRAKEDALAAARVLYRMAQGYPK